MTIETLIQWVESNVGHALHGDEGVLFGERAGAHAQATVAWMATPEVIEACAQSGSNLLIVHEDLFYPYGVLQSEQGPEGWRDWKTNRQRADLLREHGITVLRFHLSIDEICILDVFANKLGLEKPVYEEGLVKVYEIAPRRIREVIEDVKQRMQMRGLRVAGLEDPDKIVRRIGLPWGGLGLFVNIAYQQSLIEQGCELFIAGEGDNYGFRFAAECGIPTIETSHELSEVDGFRVFYEQLETAFPAVSFDYVDNPCIWEMH